MNETLSLFAGSMSVLPMTVLTLAVIMIFRVSKMWGLLSIAGLVILANHLRTHLARSVPVVDLGWAGYLILALLALAALILVASVVVDKMAPVDTEKAEGEPERPNRRLSLVRVSNRS